MACLISTTPDDSEHTSNSANATAKNFFYGSGTIRQRSQVELTETRRHPLYPRTKSSPRFRVSGKDCWITDFGAPPERPPSHA